MLDFTQFGFDDIKFAMHVEKGVLLLISAYCPTKSAKKGEIAISNYYITSNKAYKKALLVMNYLKNNGFDAEFFTEHYIKTLCATTGGFIGKNSLYIHEKFGSYINVQAIFTNYRPNEIYKQAIQQCQGCDACTHSCPTHAILDNGFNRENCLRAHVKEMFFEDKFKKCLYQVIGCEKCQHLCPHNNVNFTRGVYLDINETLQLKNFDYFKQVVGKNAAKKDNLIYQTIVYAANTRYEEAYDVISLLSEKEEFKEVCNYYFTALKAQPLEL